MPVRRDNPYGNFNFLVQIDGVEAAAFAEVEVPDATVAVIEYREGADLATAPRLLPGRVDYGNLVLRRGVAGDLTLVDWWRAIRDGNLDRRAVDVVLLDETRRPVQTWQFQRAWPTKLEGPLLRALGNETAIETLHLAHEGFDMA